MVDFNKIKENIKNNALSGDWKKWAEEADKKGNNDSELLNSVYELNYVKDQALKSAKKGKTNTKNIQSVFTNIGAGGALSQTELNHLMAGKDIEDTDVISKTGRNARNKSALNDVSKEGYSNYYTDDNGAVSTKSLNWNSVADKIIARFNKDSDPVYFDKLSQQVRLVARAMDSAKFSDGRSVKEYNSKKDVENLYDAVMNQLGLTKNDEFKDFKKNIAKEFVSIAENHQKAKEQKRLENRYIELSRNGLTVTDKAGQKSQKQLSRTEMMEELKSEFTGSYYGIYPDEYDDDAYKAMGYNGLLTDFENKTILANAERDVLNTIYSLANPTREFIEKNKLQDLDLTKSGDIEKAAKRLMGDKQDQYTDKVFAGDLSTKGKLTFQRSTIKDFRKWIAAINRVEARKVKLYTEDDFYKELKNNSLLHDIAKQPLTEEEIKAGNTKPLIAIVGRDNKTGKPLYDLSELSDLIRDTISAAQYRMDAQNKNYSEYSELKNIQRAIKDRTGVEVSEKDVKNLVDMCGFDRDKKNIWLDIFNGIIKSVPAGLINFGASEVLGRVINKAGVDLSGIKEEILSKVIPIIVNPSVVLDLDMGFEVNVTAEGGAQITEAQKEITIKSVNAQNRKWSSKYSHIVDSNGNYAGPWMEIVNKGDNKCWIKITGNLSDKVVQEDVSMRQLFDNDLDLGDPDSTLKLGSMWKNFGIMMAINAALGILDEAMKEMPPELPVLSTEVIHDTYIEYVNDLQANDRLSPKMKEGVAQLARAFENEDGTWDKAGFEEYLKKIAGGGTRQDGTKVRTSFLSLKELYNGVFAKVQGFQVAQPEPQKVTTTPEVKTPVTPAPVEKTETPVVPPQTPVTTAPTVEVSKEPETKKEEFETKAVTTLGSKYQPKQETFRSWSDLVNGYPCLAKYNKTVKSDTGKNINLSNRMTKILQAIDLQKVNIEEGQSIEDAIKNTYNIDKIAEFAEYVISHNIDEAMKKFPDFPIDKDTYLSVVNTDGGVKGKIFVPDLYDNNGKKFEWKMNGKADIESGGQNTTTLSTMTKTDQNGVTHYYKRPKGSNAEWKEISFKEYKSINGQ